MNASVKTSDKARPKVGSLTIAALRILVPEKIDTRNLPARGDRPAREMFSQDCLIVGGSKALPFAKTTFDKAETMRAGVYMLSCNALRIGKYDLELNSYEPLIYVRNMNEQEKQLLQPVETDFGDIT